MLNTDYYHKPVIIKACSNVVDYIFNQYKTVIENKNDGFPVNLNSNDLLDLGTILKEDTNSLFQDTTIKLEHGILFFLKPYKELPIHIDAQTKHDFYSSLNIPILNCEGGDMCWYSGSFYEEDILLPEGIRYSKLKMEDPTILYNSIINSPSIVRTNIPHNVVNTIDKKRIMLALRYNKNVPGLAASNEI